MLRGFGQDLDADSEATTISRPARATASCFVTREGVLICFEPDPTMARWVNNGVCKCYCGVVLVVVDASKVKREVLPANQYRLNL